MRRLVIALLTAAACLGALPAQAAGGSKAPRAVLVATDGITAVSQTGRVIYSTWDGEDFDRSRPPISWPRALKVAGASSFTVQIPTEQAPFVVEIRAWKRLRPNGKPRGKPEVSECGPPTTTGTAGTCTLVPMMTATGMQWEVQFDLKRSSGPYYLAVSAAWDDAQVAWINHLKLTE